VAPLHVASKWGRTGVVSLLIDYHANIEALTKVSDTLHTALQCSNVTSLSRTQLQLSSHVSVVCSSYAVPALSLKSKQLDELNVCWNIE